MRSTIHFAVLMVAATLLAGEGAAQASGDVALKLDPSALRAGGVGFVEVRREGNPSELSLPGTIAIPPTQLRVVAAPTDGLIEAIYVANDETVEEGQLLLEIRSPSYIGLQREFISADAEAGLARDWLVRAEQLAAAKALPERELRNAEVQARTTAFRADERRHALKAAGMPEDQIERLRKTRQYEPVVSIFAPVRGVIVARNTTTGDRIAVAESLLSIARLEPLWINLQVPASRIGLIAEGAAVAVQKLGITGRIVRVGRQVDPATQSVTAIAEVGPGAAGARPGLAVVATVRIESANAAQWVVPLESVVRHNGGTWIFVRKGSSVRATPVSVVAENGREVAIMAPLAAGDQIANRGIIALLAELARLDRE
jgi:RND family efflux transporter MFP subunit